MATLSNYPGIEPILPLMLDGQITEIMINGHQQLYVERGGVMQQIPSPFGSEDELRTMIEVLLRPTGRAVSSATPFTDFRLPDGSRGNVIIPPLALNGPVVTIRKFTRQLATAADLIRVGTLSRRMAALLAAAVAARANILFSGAAGTGKTTTLNIFSHFIPPTERILTIEDTAELQLQQPHVVRLECRKANLEGRGEVTMAQLVRNALRMRPTRIIVGEIRGEEAMDMLQAISSGHEGCLAVLHASSPADAITRLETMILSRGLLLPLWAIHRQIAASIDLIVQHDLPPDGRRKVTRITELAGVQDDRAILHDLFTYERLGTDTAGREMGRWVCSGAEPRILAKCRKLGVDVPPEVYAAGT